MGDLRHCRCEATRPLVSIPRRNRCGRELGVLQDSPFESTSAVHVEGTAHLYAACEQLGVCCVVHFSAIGVDRETPTAFSQTKLAADRALMTRNLDWVILRPSVEVGAAAYGGSARCRGLAA